jgi:hypothetical protein
MRVMIVAVLALAACAGPQPEPPEPESFRAACEQAHPVPPMPRILQMVGPERAPRVAENHQRDIERRTQTVASCVENRAALQHMADMAAWRQRGRLPALGAPPLGSALNPVYVTPAFFPAIPLQ